MQWTLHSAEAEVKYNGIQSKDYMTPLVMWSVSSHLYIMKLNFLTQESIETTLSLTSFPWLEFS